MTSADYRCGKCQKRQEVEGRVLAETIVKDCNACGRIVEMKRLWTPMHTGRGSNGEPAR